MKFVKVLKAASNKKYVIFENIASDNVNGYWTEDGELANLQEATIFESLDEAKFQVNAQIKRLQQIGEQAEHYFAIREIKYKYEIPAVYETYFNKEK